MPDLRSVCIAALKLIKPSAADVAAMRAVSERLLATAQQLAKAYAAKPMLCGSSEKGTWLAQKRELDLFLLFSHLLPRQQLEDFGLRLAKDIMAEMGGQWRIAYAEHPYLTGTITHNGLEYRIDIVPCYDIADPSKIKSAVDRTPHHVHYIKQNLKLHDEARLLKAFAMAAGCYGADVRVQGFSGYLCELLILNYGTFADFVAAAAEWRAGLALDVRGDKVATDRLFEKFRAPLIFIDPVDPNRNVAAALSVETFYRFVRACRDFVRNPSIKFFKPAPPKPYSSAELARAVRARGTRWYLITFSRPKVVDDILWPQMRRCLTILQTLLHAADFEVLRKAAWADSERCVLVLEMKEWLLPRIDKNIGPNVYSRYAGNFLKHYHEHRVFIEDEKWVVELPHKHTDALSFLKELLAKPETELLKAGIPSHLAAAMTGAKVSSGSDAIRAMAQLPPDFRVWIRDWFETDLNIAN